MPPNAVLETLARLWPLLQAAGTQAAIADGIAISYWGNPRSTQDIDLAILADDTKDLAKTLNDAGFQQTDKPRKQLGLFALEQWKFDSHEYFVEIEVDLMLATSEYYHTVMQRSVTAHLPDVAEPVAVLNREDLILCKLYSARLIDQSDVLHLMLNHWPDLDHNYLNHWSGKLGLESELATAIDRYTDEQ